MASALQTGGEHVTDGGEHVTNGGEHVTNGGDGMANGGRGTPSNVSHTAPISAISDITNKVRASRESCLLPKQLFAGNLSGLLATIEEIVPESHKAQRPQAGMAPIFSSWHLLDKLRV